MEQNHSDVKSIENLVSSCINIRKEISKIVIGQNNIVDKLLMTIFGGGHAMLLA